MKKLFVLGIIAVMVMGMAVSANAAIDSLWMMQLRAYNGAATPIAWSTLTLGTKVGASDGYTTTSSEDAIAANPTGTPGMLVSNIVANQLTSKDVRSPLAKGETKVWDLLMYVVGDTSNQNIRLDGWMAANANQLNESTDGDPNITLTLMQGDTVLWAVPYNTSGSQSVPTFTTQIAYTGTPIALKLVAQTVPEPGSMVALMSGLVGLVGFGIRRKK